MLGWCSPEDYSRKPPAGGKSSRQHDWGHRNGLLSKLLRRESGPCSSLSYPRYLSQWRRHGREFVHFPVYVNKITILSQEKFADAVKGFHDLKNLHLGILLSSCDILNEHTKHDVGASDARPSTVKSIPNCPRCKQHAKETSRCELSTGLAIANRLPSLETISWITTFPVSFSKDGKISQENCVECDLDRYPNCIQFSIVNSQYAEDLENDHWRIACFTVQRTYDRLRLLRTS